MFINAHLDFCSGLKSPYTLNIMELLSHSCYVIWTIYEPEKSLGIDQLSQTLHELYPIH